MTTEEQKARIQQLYDQIHGYQYKSNADILYNIIHAKSKFGLNDFHQSLYLDIKQFVTNYMNAANKADYGYDEILLEKIIKATKCLDDKNQQKAILCSTRRKYQIQGYEIDEITSEINGIDIKIACKERKYFKAFCLFAGSNLWILLISYFCYIIGLALVLLPAPYEWMGIFTIDLKNYSSCGFANHVANTVMLICGSDDAAPTIIPNCALGVVVYVLGILLFYFFFMNFILKKIDDLLTIK